MDELETARCGHCRMVQFVLPSRLCRRCKKPLAVEIVVPVPPREPLSAEPGHEREIFEGAVALRIRTIRESRGMSQRRLAARMDVPRTWISKVETGRACPTLWSLHRIVKALGVEIHEVV